MHKIRFPKFKGTMTISNKEGNIMAKAKLITKHDFKDNTTMVFGISAARFVALIMEKENNAKS